VRYGVRTVPIFPELRPLLDKAYDDASDGAEFVIARYRNPNKNFRTRFLRIIRRAGVTPWTKPFQNLRASRETELAATYPLHVVCAWIGNSATIAQKHYLQVTDDYFERAQECGAKSGAREAQNEAQKPNARIRNHEQESTEGELASEDTPLVAIGCEDQKYAWRDANGLPELASSAMTYVKEPEAGGAKGGSIPNDPLALNPNLAQIVAAGQRWPTQSAGQCWR
jgi:hypothetical protein